MMTSSELVHRAAETLRLMVGVPDYERYVAHCREQHPDEPVMTRAAFFRECQRRRYGGDPDRIGRCC